MCAKYAREWGASLKNYTRHSWSRIVVASNYVKVISKTVLGMKLSKPLKKAESKHTAISLGFDDTGMSFSELEYKNDYYPRNEPSRVIWQTAIVVVVVAIIMSILYFLWHKRYKDNMAQKTRVRLDAVLNVVGPTLKKQEETIKTETFDYNQLKSRLEACRSDLQSFTEFDKDVLGVQRMESLEIALRYIKVLLGSADTLHSFALQRQQTKIGTQRVIDDLSAISFFPKLNERVRQAIEASSQSTLTERSKLDGADLIVAIAVDKAIPGHDNKADWSDVHSSFVETRRAALIYQGATVNDATLQANKRADELLDLYIRRRDKLHASIVKQQLIEEKITRARNDVIHKKERGKRTRIFDMAKEESSTDWAALLVMLHIQAVFIPSVILIAAWEESLSMLSVETCVQLFRHSSNGEIPPLLVYLIPYVKFLPYGICRAYLFLKWAWHIVLVMGISLFYYMANFVLPRAVGVCLGVAVALIFAHNIMAKLLHRLPLLMLPLAWNFCWMFFCHIAGHRARDSAMRTANNAVFDIANVEDVLRWTIYRDIRMRLILRNGIAPLVGIFLSLETAITIGRGYGWVTPIVFDTPLFD